jgi:RNA polymerase sigma-70 factor (ECF subfamily)
LYDHLVDSGVQPGEERPEDIVLERLTTADVQAAIDELSEEFRQVVVLADVEGFSYREIADIVGIPVGTVMSRLFRARRRLRRVLYDLAVDSGYIKGLATDGGL